VTGSLRETIPERVGSRLGPGRRVGDMTLDDILHLSPAVALVTLRRAEDAIPLARALVRGGVRVVEIALRTSRALQAISAIRGAVPDAVVGAGAVTRTEDLDHATAAGAQFAASLGTTAELLRAARNVSIPFLPGIATASELMAGRLAGFTRFRLFPAREAGGPRLLSAFAEAFPEAVLCPSGGIEPESAPEYLALSNVPCVGATWLAPPELVASGSWDAIGALARDASALRARA
jgi:2-dehydro-3-deoxyphosphogluconate aldolase/(4S)-4-hydroxy-2-oxoglutarate aldolase